MFKYLATVKHICPFVQTERNVNKLPTFDTQFLCALSSLWMLQCVYRDGVLVFNISLSELQ